MQGNHDPQAHLYDLSRPLQSQLKMTARVALGISVLATVVLMLTLYYLFKDQQQDSYLRIIQSLTRSQEQLVPAMLIGGAMIMLAAGIITWFILLYSSARIAGPLYRFSRNVEMQINQGPVATVQLRKGDYLQELSVKLSQAATGLHDRNARQLEIVDEMYRNLGLDQVPDSVQYNQFLQQLEDRVKIKK